MSETTNISWCDSTVNFFSGCTKVSAGCLNCYAEARDNRHMQEKVSHWGKGAPRLKHKGAVKDALALNRKPWICDRCGEGFSEQMPGHISKGGRKCYPENEETPLTYHRRRVFSLSLGDWLDEEVPIEWLAEMLDTIRQCDQVNWLLLTKRPGNFRSRLQRAADQLALKEAKFETANWIAEWHDGNSVPKNIWIGTSTENQEQADKRIPELFKIPAAVRFLSVEPMLGPIRFNPVTLGWNKIHQMIFGGESGKGARHLDVDWIRSGVEQCKAANVSCFVKQMGANVMGREMDKWVTRLKDPKGGDMSEWPDDLRVREFPTPPTP